MRGSVGIISLLFLLLVPVCAAEFAVERNADGIPAIETSAGIFPESITGAAQDDAYQRLLIARQTAGMDAVLFYDDFEDGDMNGWLGSGCSASVTNATAANGTEYSMTLTGSCGHYVGRYHTLDSITPGYISVWMRSGSVGASDTYFVIGDNNISGNNGIIFMYASSNHYWRVYSSSGYNYLYYNANQWYHHEFLVDWNAKTFDVYTDEVLYLSNIPFRSQSTVSLTQVHFYNYTSSTGWWDELYIQDEAGPADTPTPSPTATASPTPTITPTPTATGTPPPIPASSPPGVVLTLLGMSAALWWKRRKSKQMAE